MPTVAESPHIRGVFVVQPDIHTDARGRFIETWRKDWIPIAREMVQANRADRAIGSLVGLHYHLRQSDYWYVPFGRALVVLHDLRAGSPTDGATLTLEIGEYNHRGVYIPPGVAHGFYALTDLTITYLVDATYDPADELGLAWDEPAVGGVWPLGDAPPVLSLRDQTNPRRGDIPAPARPRFESRDVLAR